VASPRMHRGQIASTANCTLRLLSTSLGPMNTNVRLKMKDTNLERPPTNKSAPEMPRSRQFSFELSPIRIEAVTRNAYAFQNAARALVCDTRTNYNIELRRRQHRPAFCGDGAIRPKTEQQNPILGTLAESKISQRPIKH